MRFAPWVRLEPHVRLRDPMSGDRRRTRSILLLLLMLLAALGGCHALFGGDKRPPSLPGYRAAGARDEVNCLRIVVADDVSGSMTDFAAARDTALGVLFTWLKRNLQADDQVAIIDFAAVANVQMPPTPVSRLGALPAVVGTRDGTYTYFRPVLADIAGFPPTSCDTALLLVSDAQLIDLPATRADGVRLLRADRVDRIRLLVPGQGVTVGSTWAEGFPAAVPLVFNGLDQQATGLALGTTIVGLTGQKLVPIG